MPGELADQDMSKAEEIAKAFHHTYEELAPSFGYETREASKRDWEYIPPNNKALMIATVQRLLDEGTILW